MRRVVQKEWRHDSARRLTDDGHALDEHRLTPRFPGRPSTTKTEVQAMRPSRNTVLMNHAWVAALRATCPRQSVGVVIARDGRVLVTGYNGAPAGMKHCEHPCDCSLKGS